jgi:hypothetical protein
LGWWHSQLNGKITNVWNHQPGIIWISSISIGLHGPPLLQPEPYQSCEWGFQDAWLDFTDSCHKSALSKLIYKEGSRLRVQLVQPHPETNNNLITEIHGLVFVGDSRHRKQPGSFYRQISGLPVEFPPILWGIHGQSARNPAKNDHFLANAENPIPKDYSKGFVSTHPVDWPSI